MSRPTPEPIEAGGQDSFVDVVTNLVGIVIVLVLIVGVRIKHVPASGGAVPGAAGQSSGDSNATAAASFRQLESTAVGIEQDIHHVAGQIAAIDRVMAARAAERERVATLVAAGEHELADRRASLDAGAREEFDLQRETSDLKHALDESGQELAQAQNERAPPVELKNYPTPLSRTVFGKEIHFQLAAGRIAYVPVEELFERAKSTLTPDGATLSELTDREHTAGPYAGFELQYTVEAVEEGHRGQVGLRSKEWRAVPVAGQVGEATQEALAPTSDFHRRLALLDAKQTTVTIWVYPDSFADFRTLRDELYRLGFAIAARPLPPGLHVAGSSRGTKSAAQ